MTRPVREVVAALVGIAVLSVVCWLWISFGYARWHAEIKAAAHPPGWVRRTGTVVKVGDQQPSENGSCGDNCAVTDGRGGSDGEPYVPVTVRYSDEVGRSRTVELDLTPGTVQQDWAPFKDLHVNQDGAVYDPGTIDNYDQYSGSVYPGAPAHHDGGWPGLAFFLMLVCGIPAGFLAGLVTDETLRFLSRLSGRLGTK